MASLLERLDQRLDQIERELREIKEHLRAISIGVEIASPYPGAVVKVTREDESLRSAP